MCQCREAFSTRTLGNYSECDEHTAVSSWHRLVVVVSHAKNAEPATSTFSQAEDS